MNYRGPEDRDFLERPEAFGKPDGESPFLERPEAFGKPRPERREEPPLVDQRLHPVGMLLDALGTIRQWIGVAAFPGLAALFGGGFRPTTLVMIFFFAFVLVVFAAVWGVLSWRATTYEVRGGTFTLRRGVVQKSERSLQLERIQSVDTVQGVIQRLFNVVEVRVETAGGGSDPDVKLPALSREAARVLQERLTGHQRRGAEETARPEREVLRSLSVRELLVAGATSGQIGVAASLVAGASQLVQQVLPETLAARVFEVLLPRSVGMALLFAGVLLVFAWILAIGGTFLSYYGFTLSRTEENLHIRRGLLKRYESTIPLARIQAVRVVEGVLRQPFGLAFLRVDSAGYGAEEGTSTTLFPLLPVREVHRLLETAAPEFAAPVKDVEPVPGRALRRYLIRASIPAVIVGGIVAFNLWFATDSLLWPALAGLLLPPALLHGWLRFRAAGWNYADDRLLLRFRNLARTTVVAPRKRLQSRTLSRTPFQRRLGLASFEVQVASGSTGAEFSVLDLDRDDARDLLERTRPRAARGS
jgi:putative membrane protein